MAYWVGAGFFKPDGFYGVQYPYAHFDVTAAPGQWHDLTINVKRDYERTAHKKRFEALRLDRMIVTLGVWNWNERLDDSSRIGIYFDDIAFSCDCGHAPPQSSLDGNAIGIKDDIRSRD
jgi:hypothetical protein